MWQIYLWDSCIGIALHCILISFPQPYEKCFPSALAVWFQNNIDFKGHISGAIISHS